MKKLTLDAVLRTAIKVAAVLLTLPATWAVAGTLYPAGWQRVVVQLAAAVLVEGALMLGWHLLDTARTASSTQRTLYAVLAGTAYFVLWAVALKHGEGAIGLAFRATLGIVLLFSMIDAGLLANLKIRRAAERDIAAHPAVRRYRTRRAVEFARAEIDAGYTVAGERLQVQTRLELDAARTLIGQVSDTSRTPARRKSRTGRQLAAAIATNPDVSKTALAQLTGVSRDTVYRQLDTLAAAGELVADGTTASGYRASGNGGNGNGKGR